MVKKAVKRKKRWSDYTSKDVAVIVKERCVNCPYVNTTQCHNYGIGCVYCDYLSIVGHSRGCMSYECEHYKDDPKKVQELKNRRKKKVY